MMNKPYTLYFSEYGDMPCFSGKDITGEEVYAEMYRLFKNEDGSWDYAKIYAARLAYVEANNLDPGRYNVRAYHLSSWQGPPPTPEPSPAKTRKRNRSKPTSKQELGFAGPRRSMTPAQRRRLFFAGAAIGDALRQERR